jgi:hypothetical protein
MFFPKSQVLPKTRSIGGPFLGLEIDEYFWGCPGCHREAIGFAFTKLTHMFQQVFGDNNIPVHSPPDYESL